MADVHAPDPSPSLPEDRARGYARLPSRDLVWHLKEAAADPSTPNAQAILTAFYHRYGPFLASVIACRFGGIADPSARDEILHDTFAAFFQDCRFEPNRTWDDDACERNLRKYLAALAHWKIKQARAFLLSLGRDGIGDFSEFERAVDRSHAISAPPSPDPAPDGAGRHARVAAWLATLSERDRDLLWTYYLDDHARQRSARIPSGVLKTLAEKYSVTPSALRHRLGHLRLQFRREFSSDSQS